MIPKKPKKPQKNLKMKKNKQEKMDKDESQEPDESSEIDQENDIDDDEKVPFTSHLEELRNRLLVSIVFVLIAFVGCYYFKEQIYDILRKPMLLAMPELEFVVIGVADLFFIGCER